MKKISLKMMGKKITSVCLGVVMFTVVTAGGTYAVTGGDTVNPFEAFNIFIDGKDAKDKMIKEEDGNYSIKLRANEEFLFENEEIKAKIAVPENPTKGDITVKFNPDGENINVDVGE